MCSIRHHSLTFLLLWGLLPQSQAWVNLAVTPSTRTFTQRQALAPTLLFSTKTDSNEKEKEKETPETSSSSSNSNSNSNSSAAVATVPVEAKTDKKEEDEEEEDDDDYEYIEYETLTEAEYLGSEWMIGTLWDNNPNNIKETWVRLATKEDKNIAIWGDGAEGKWSLDTASQFLAISKQYLWGKQIWAGVVDDYYFSQGTVRGWTFLTPASVLGQWQAKRLGVDPDEAGTAPWFEAEDDEDEQEESSSSSNNNNNSAEEA